MEAAGLLDYQKMYCEAEHTQATESNKDEAEGSKGQERSDEDEGFGGLLQSPI